MRPRSSPQPKIGLGALRASAGPIDPIVALTTPQRDRRASCGRRGSTGRCDTERRHGGGDREVAGAVRTRGGKGERRWRRRLWRPAGRRGDERRGRTARARGHALASPCAGLSSCAARPRASSAAVTPGDGSSRTLPRMGAAAAAHGVGIGRLAARVLRARLARFCRSFVCDAFVASITRCLFVIPLEMFAGFFTSAGAAPLNAVPACCSSSPSPAGSPARDCGVLRRGAWRGRKRRRWRYRWWYHRRNWRYCCGFGHDRHRRRLRHDRRRRRDRDGSQRGTVDRHDRRVVGVRLRHGNGRDEHRRRSRQPDGVESMGRSSKE